MTLMSSNLEINTETKIDTQTDVTRTIKPIEKVIQTESSSKIKPVVISDITVKGPNLFKESVDEKSDELASDKDMRGSQSKFSAEEGDILEKEGDQASSIQITEGFGESPSTPYQSLLDHMESCTFLKKKG